MQSVRTNGRDHRLGDGLVEESIRKSGVVIVMAPESRCRISAAWRKPWESSASGVGVPPPDLQLANEPGGLKHAVELIGFAPQARLDTRLERQANIARADLIARLQLADARHQRLPLPARHAASAGPLRDQD